MPTIWLVLDGSGSMLDVLSSSDSTTRFDALKQALMDPKTGVVKQLEHDVQWGYIIYDGPLPGGISNTGLLPDGGMVTFTAPPATTCPRAFVVEPKKDNYDDIAAMYPPDPLGGSTPTDKALKLVTQHAVHGPTTVVLATDGAPNDFCAIQDSPGTLSPPDVRPDVIAAVHELAAAKVKTYVISLAGDDMMLSQHLQEVAQVGMSGMPPFTPQNAGELLAVFQLITLQEALCTLELHRQVKPTRACDADVELAGSKLTCNAADGFSIDDPATLRLQGAACAKYKADPSALRVGFPCDALQAPKR